MRDIKFRAWDKKLKKYINLEKIVIEPLDGIVIETAGFDMIGNNDDAVLEQYTGLKDFNGIEIYEGDILQDVDDSTIVGVVEYDEAYGEYSCGDDSLYEATRCCVVIGNIHENADLLEVGNDI